MVRRLAVLAAGLVLVSTAPLGAQAPMPPVANQLYGSGVHAYFTADYPRAFELLNSTVQSGGGSDPRTFYFRGLVYLRMGRPDEAKQDFLKASQLEAANPDRVFGVSRALERVQGSDRMMLEQYRAEARSLAYQRSEEYRRRRYEELKREEQRVLQSAEPRVAPGAGLPVAPSVDFGEKGPPPKPVVAPGTAPTTPTAPAVAPKESIDAIFGPPATPAATPAAPAPAAEENPFDAASTTVPAKTPAAKKATSAPAKVEVDPFGEPAAPASPAKPAAPAEKAPMPPADVNPFDADSPPAKPGVAKKPAVGEVPAPNAADDFFARPLAPPKPAVEPAEPAEGLATPKKAVPPKAVTAKKAAPSKPEEEAPNPFDSAPAPKKAVTSKKATAPAKPKEEDVFGEPADDAGTAVKKKTAPRKAATAIKRAASKKADDAVNPFDDNPAPEKP